MRELDLRESGLLEDEATPALLAQLERLDVSIEPRDARYDGYTGGAGTYMPWIFEYHGARAAQVSVILDEVSARLRWLGLAGARMTRAHVRQLRGGQIEALEVLDVRGCGLAEDALLELLGLPVCDGLRALALGENALGPAAFERLAREGRLRHLAALDASNISHGGRSVLMVQQWGQVRALRARWDDEFDFLREALEGAGAHQRQEMTHYMRGSGHRALSESCNDPGERGLEALCDGVSASLRSLGLRRCGLGHRERSEAWRRSRCWDLMAPGVRVVLETPFVSPYRDCLT